MLGSLGLAAIAGALVSTGALAASFDGRAAEPLDLSAAPRFERAAAAAVAAAPRPEPADPALEDLSSVLADRAAPALLAELARYRPSCLSWRPSALHVECRYPRVRRDVPAQPLFLATKFVVVMYGSRGYLVYVPRAPAAIRGGEDIRRAAVPIRTFAAAVLAAQRIQAQRALDQARRR